MEAKPLSLQYAHADGHTSICYSGDGMYIITCGSDGDVRMWTGVADEDPISECVGESALALSFNENHFYVGTDNNYVQAYTFPDPKRDGIICRFTAPVTHITINERGTLIAACSCDMEIQVSSLNASSNITKMIGHTAPVTGVAIDPMDAYLASSSCDGSVKIWDLATGSLIKTLANMFPTCNDFFRAFVLGRPSWQSKTGGFLAVPSGQEVLLHDRDSWTVTIKLTDPCITSPLSLTASSPCGNYLAAISTFGDVSVWDTNNNRTISLYCHPKKAAISGLVWHPDGRALAVCDRLGQYAVLEDVLEASNLSFAPENNFIELGDNDIDEDDDAEMSLEEIKKSSRYMSPSKDDDDDSVVNDNRSVSIARVPIQHIQPPFQPSSTPIHLQHRFMFWNSIGIIRCFNTEEEKSIDVEFHDSMFHHAIHLNNLEDFTLAALSNKVLVLAAPSSDEQPSKLKCILLNAWDGSKEWTVTMPFGENIQAVAADGDWVAVATDHQHLRVFSYAGTQRQPFSLPGPVVALTGHENKIAAVYHQGLGISESQNLGVMVLEIMKVIVFTSAASQPLPLSPQSTLKWCGFTDEGRLCSFDSVGVLRSLAIDSKHWTLLTDTRLQNKGISDNYFIIGVCERYQNVRCVLCKGSYYPMTTPRPTVVEIPLKIPLCEIETEKSELEESFWRLMQCFPLLEVLNSKADGWQMDVSDMEKRLKQLIIKLFANACRSDLDMRAIDLATLMPEQVLQMAAKYASKYGKMTLAEKLNDVEPIDWSEICNAAFCQNAAVTSNVHHTSIDQQLHVENASQRDMFTTTVSADRLILVEKENELQSMTPEVTPSSEYTNPFQVKSSSKEGPRGLSFFDKPLPSKPKCEPLRSTPVVKLKGSKTKATESKSQPEKSTFLEWFGKTKPNLMKEYPDLNPSDLVKKAMQIYRTEISASKNLHKEDVNESYKRKLDETDPGAAHNIKKVASEKLSAFAFKPKS